MRTPIERSFSRPTSWSISRGTGMDPRSQAPPRLHHVLRAQRLVGKAHIHHAGRVSFCRGKIDEPTLGEQVNSPSIGKRVLPHNVPDVSLPDRQLFHRLDIYLYVEVSTVGHQRAVFHYGQVLGVDCPEASR